jgi:ribulose-phosphate 3-epimerase
MGAGPGRCLSRPESSIGKTAGRPESRRERAMQVKISPSIISADLTRLGEQLAEVAAAGVEFWHVDVADGHFVPNIMAGPDLCAAVQRCGGAVTECHLMMTDPLKHAPAFVKAGARRIFFHAETVEDLPRAVGYLRDLGVGPGIAFKPRQAVDVVEPVVGLLDCLMAMTVEPGFSGQSFMEAGCEKIPALRRMFGQDIDIYVDGGIGPATAPVAIGYGANVMIAASGIFQTDVAPGEAVRRLRSAAHKGLEAYLEKADPHR